MADGPPIKDYYPAVVDEATLNVARAAMKVRKPLEGRRGAVGNRIHLFSRLVFDAPDGIAYYPWFTRRDQADGSKQHWWSLVCSSAGQGRGPKSSFPLPTFEKAILSMLAGD